MIIRGIVIYHDGDDESYSQNSTDLKFFSEWNKIINLGTLLESVIPKILMEDIKLSKSSFPQDRTSAKPGEKEQSKQVKPIFREYLDIDSDASEIFSQSFSSSNGEH